MPRIETYNGPQVQQRALSGATYSANATAQQMGAGVGRAISQAGQVLNQNAQKMKAEDDQAKVKAQLAEFRKQLNQRTYLDDDAYYNRKGIEAYETFEPMLNEFDEVRTKMAEGLSQDQARVFNEAAQQYITNEHGQMSRFASAERNNWLNDQDQAVIEQAQADGALRYMDNGKYAAQIDTTLSVMADRNGWPEEKVQQEREKYLSAMHVQALDNLFAKSPGVAKDYYETHKESISPDLHDDIEEQIETSDRAVWVEESAAQIRLAGGSRTERMKQINDLTDDPERRKALRQQVDYDLAQENRAQQEAAVSAYDEAYSAIVDPMGAGLSPVQFQATNPELWDAMTPSQKNSILSATGTGKKAITTQLPVYNEVLGMINSGDSTTEEVTDFILNNADQLSNADAKSLLKSAQDIGKAASSSEKNPFNSDAKSQFNDWIEATVGPEPSTSDEKDRMAYNQRRNILRGMYVNSLTEGMSYNDRTQLLDQMTRKFLIDDPGWINKDRQTEVDLFSIDGELLNEYQVGFNAIGIPMTDENLRQAIEMDADLSNPDYTEAATALRKAGQEVTLGKIQRVIDYFYSQTPR